jgi:hypothetical protein
MTMLRITEVVNHLKERGYSLDERESQIREWLPNCRLAFKSEKYNTLLFYPLSGQAISERPTSAIRGLIVSSLNALDELIDLQELEVNQITDLISCNLGKTFSFQSYQGENLTGIAIKTRMCKHINDEGELVYQLQRGEYGGKKIVIQHPQAYIFKLALAE